jgi:hypothetical protein
LKVQGFQRSLGVAKLFRGASGTGMTSNTGITGGEGVPAWIGFHDALAAFRFYLLSGQPAFVFPFTFVTPMFLGLAKSRAAVFQSQSKLKGSANPAKV